MTEASRHLAFVRQPAPDALAIEPRALAALQPGDYLGAPLIVGLCGTDLQILRGLRDDPAEVLGHEGVIAVQAGDGLSGRYLLNPTSTNPGLPMLGHTLDGLLQQRVRIPAALGRNLLPVPDALDDDLVVLAEPLGAVVLALRAIVACAPPRRLLIVGRGAAGQLFARAAMGLCPTLEDVRLVGSDQVLGGERYDAAVVCGARDRAAAGLSLALSTLSQGGVVHLFGGLPQGFRHLDLPLPDIAAVRARHTAGLSKLAPGELIRRTDGSSLWVTGSRGASSEDLATAMATLVREPSQYRPLLRIETDPEAFLARIREAVAAPGRRHWTKLAFDMRGWDA